MCVNLNLVDVLLARFPNKLRIASYDEYSLELVAFGVLVLTKRQQTPGA